MSGGYLELSAIAPRLSSTQGADRGLIAGRSGSGKSVLAQNLLAVYGLNAPAAYRGNLVIVDPNFNFEFPASLTTDEPDAVRPSKQHPVIRYTPPPDARDAEAWNGLMKRLFYCDVKRLMLYVDELYAMEPLFLSRRLESGPNYLNAYLTQGRARGRGALFSVQRPVAIPRNVIAQAEWFYCFDLPVRDDRTAMADVMGRDSDQGEDITDRKVLQRYEFWHINPSLRDPVRMKIKL